MLWRDHFENGLYTEGLTGSWAVQIVRELKAMGQALRPPRNRPNRSVVGASVSSSELDARGIPSGKPGVISPIKVQILLPLLFQPISIQIPCRFPALSANKYSTISLCTWQC